MELFDENEMNETLYVLATLIAAYSNPHMFPFDLAKLPEIELKAELSSLKGLMKEMIG